MMTEEEIAAGLLEKHGDEIELPKRINMGGMNIDDSPQRPGMTINDPPQQTPEEAAAHRESRVTNFLLTEDALRKTIRIQGDAITEMQVEKKKLENRIKTAQEAFAAERGIRQAELDKYQEDAVASELVNFDFRRATAEANLRYEWVARVNPDLDYRYLLYLYMRHVGEQEGIDFVTTHDHPSFMSGKQWGELRRLAEMA